MLAPHVKKHLTSPVSGKIKLPPPTPKGPRRSIRQSPQPADTPSAADNARISSGGGRSSGRKGGDVESAAVPPWVRRFKSADSVGGKGGGASPRGGEGTDAEVAKAVGEAASDTGSNHLCSPLTPAHRADSSGGCLLEDRYCTWHINKITHLDQTNTGFLETIRTDLAATGHPL